jgi:hypothetical protein
MVPGPRDTTYADGAILRQLHEMLRKEDPGFADLRKVPDRHGQWRWVPVNSSRYSNDHCRTY